jgi:hypothetical protein
MLYCMNCQELKGLSNSTHRTYGACAYCGDIKDCINSATTPSRISELETVLGKLVDLLECDDPIEVGCHCTQTDEHPIQCVWCEAKDLLEKGTKAVQDPTAHLAAWVLERWDAEVGNRPLENVHRRTLDNTWAQVYRKLTGCPIPRPETNCEHEWGGDGQHQNVYCKKCFTSKEHASDPR